VWLLLARAPRACKTWRVKQKDFEARVLDIWMRTRIPITVPNVQVITREDRAKVKQWLDAMTVEGVLDADVGASGEMIWSVLGAERSRSGPDTVDQMERLDRLGAEVGGATKALALAGRFAGGGGSLVRGGEQKSVIASGALSFFLGPLGWLYAAPLREAVPAIAITAIAGSVLPAFLLWPIMGLVGPVSAAAGVYYAWRHNQTGHRSGLFSDDK